MTRYQGENILFVTGRLAKPTLSRMLPQLQSAVGFRGTIQIMPITVAALMTPEWIAKHLKVPDECDRILLPGYCDGDLDPITQLTDVPVQFGPKDVRQLPDFFGRPAVSETLEDYDIDIIAEINNVPRLTTAEVLSQAKELVRDGADVIDLGCEPGQVFTGIGDLTRALRDEGIRVSIDSFEIKEIEAAVGAGAELVLSVNSSNKRAAVDWGCDVVVVPDSPDDWLQMSDTVEYLAERDVSMRLDPILNPIGLGFVDSLYRYMQVRQIWPEAEIMMGIGNVTELTDVDSAGVNVLLLAMCQELGVRSVLTTQVINWARTSVKECAIARRLVYQSVKDGIPPKNLLADLVCLRDERLLEMTNDEIAELAEQIKDNNFRIFAKNGEIHLLSNQRHWHGRDPFSLLDELLDGDCKNLDASHAFYLGFELCKANLALQLGKEYSQDESLSWGHLTEQAISHQRLKKRKATRNSTRNP